MDGYTIEPCEKETVGTDVIMSIKANADEENYDEYLAPYALSNLIKKYSDYIRYPIRVEMEHSRQKPKPEDAGDDYKPEYEQVKEWETINSMVPIWQRPKSQVTKEEYNDFYKSKFGDWQDPVLSIHVAAEGNFEYKALLYIPSQVPMNYFSVDYKKGLQLYSSGVMIMDKCPDLLPDHFSFVQGIVDTPDVSLNISREMLQHDRQLKVIANNIEKKIKNELVKLMKDDREKYQQFWTAFGMQFKYSLMNAYGQNRDTIRDLLLFWSSKENKLTSLKEYVDRMPGVPGEDLLRLRRLRGPRRQDAPGRAGAEGRLRGPLPHRGRGRDRPANAGERLRQTLRLRGQRGRPSRHRRGKGLRRAGREGPQGAAGVRPGDPEGPRVQGAYLQDPQSGTVCLTADGPVSLEMEKYFLKMRRDFPMSAERVLELNPDAAAFQALCKAFEEDKDKAAKYIEVLYNQALIIADLPLPDPARYAELVCGLMQ